MKAIVRFFLVFILFETVMSIHSGDYHDQMQTYNKLGGDFSQLLLSILIISLYFKQNFRKFAAKNKSYLVF